MELRPLGNTGIRVSTVAMGCWPLAGDAAWGPQDEGDSIATVHAALDAGVTLFDNAEAYGDGLSEQVLGKALKGRRSQAVIATKVSGNHLRPEEVEAACQRSLNRLQTDTIDLYQIHWASPDVPLADTIAALAKLRDRGAIRSFGVGNFGVVDMGELLPLATPAVNQLPYSLLWRGIEDEVLPMCVAHRIGVLAYSPLAQGLLTGKFASIADVPEGRARTRHYSRQHRLTRHGEEGAEPETFAAVEGVRQVSVECGIPMAELALAWVLAQPGVTSVLAGARRPAQIVENARAGNVRLAPDVRARLAVLTEELKSKLGSNLDQYQAESRLR